MSRYATTPTPHRVWLWTAALFAVAVVATAPVLHATQSSTAVPWLAGWLPLVLGFAIAEGCVVHMTVGRQANSFAFSEIPLVVALFVASPAQLVSARIAGTFLALAVVRRQPPVKLAFNVAQYWIGSLIAVLLWHAVVDGSHNHLLTSAAAVMVAVSVAAFSWLALQVVLALVGVRQHRAATARVAATSVLTGIANTALAIVGLAVADVSWTLLWSVGIVLAFLAVAQRSHVRLQRRHDSLQRLNTFAADLGEHLSTASIVDDILIGAVAALDGQNARLELVDAITGGVTVMRYDGQRTTVTAGAEHADVAVAAAARRWSRRRRQTEVSAALVVDGVAVGTLTVGCHGDVKAFGPDDQHVLDALAQHANAALANGRLTDRLRAQLAENQHQATHDSLTGLANRLMFERVADQLLREGEAVAVMLLDLDRFKEVNDTLGHAAGDALLQDVGGRLTMAIPDAACIARLGGDEFTVLLRTDDVDEACRIAEQARVALLSPLDVRSVPVSVDASIGVAISGAANTCADLLRHADVAMYAAKAGRGTVEFYRTEIDHHDTSRLSLVADLRAAIEASQIAVVYQPQVSLNGSGRTSVEALVRWTHPVHGPVPPDEFIPVAEQTGVILTLTDYVLTAALTECRRWLDMGLDISVSVNLSPRVLRDSTFCMRLTRMLEHHRVPASRVILEITEGAVMADVAHAIDVLWQLRRAGVGLAVDDLGVGHSSLAYLKQLPIHEVKIDKSFVLTMADDLADDAIVCAITGLAHRLGMRVVAEGVETERVVDRLRQIGCDTAQGYWYSRPVSAAEATEYFVKAAARIADKSDDEQSSRSSTHGRAQHLRLHG